MYMQLQTFVPLLLDCRTLVSCSCDCTCILVVLMWQRRLVTEARDVCCCNCKTNSIMHKLCITTAAGWGKQGQAGGTHSEASASVSALQNVGQFHLRCDSTYQYYSVSGQWLVSVSCGLICSHESCEDSCWRWPLYCSDGWSDGTAGSWGEYGVLLSGNWQVCVCMLACGESCCFLLISNFHS